MVADLSRITSLDAPPPDWDWSDLARMRHERMRSRQFHTTPELAEDPPSPTQTPSNDLRRGPNQSSWTAEQDALLYDLAGLIPPSEIAERVSAIGPRRSIEALRTRASDLGYSLRKRRKAQFKWSRWTEPEEVYLLEMLGRLPIDEVTRRLNERFATQRRHHGVRVRAARLGRSTRVEGLLPQYRVCDLLAVGHPRLRQWIGAGLLKLERPGIGRGSDWGIRPHDLEVFIRAHPELVRWQDMPAGRWRDAARTAALANPWLTITQAAAALKLHPDTIWRKCRSGRVPGLVKVGRRYRIPIASLAGLRERPSYPKKVAS